MATPAISIPWTIHKIAVDEPEEGESGTIYEYEVRNGLGHVIVTLYDETHAQLIASAPDHATVVERLKFQEDVLRKALERTGHTGAIRFFEETIRLNDAAIAKSVRC